MDKKIKQTVTSDACRKGMLAVNDALELLSGKWKIKIIAFLLKEGAFCFREMLREIEGIGSKMLSKNLQELEANQLVTRTVRGTRPVTVEYRLTAHGESLREIIDTIEAWGMNHRALLLSGMVANK